VVLLVSLDSSAALPQRSPDFFGIIGGLMNAAMIDTARKQWRTRPAAEINCLAGHGVSADYLASQGVAPTDPRIHNLVAQCDVSLRSTPAQSEPALSRSAEAKTSYNPKFVVDAIALGAAVQPESDPDHSYKCEPSEQFPGFVWCRRTRSEQGKFGPHSSSVSILHSPEGDAVYISKSISPASFAKGDVEREINRLSHEFGLAANVLRSEPKQGRQEGVLVTWGEIKLTALDNEAMDDLRQGRPVRKGLLFDFLGNARQSAKDGMPVYSGAGGQGFVWGATIDKDGKGILRITTMDANSLERSTPSGFVSFERALQLPPTCETLRTGGAQPPNPMGIRDSFSGNMMPDPVCVATMACYGDVSRSVADLIVYLREHPLLVGELKKAFSREDSGSADQMIAGLIGTEQQLQLNPPDCSFAYNHLNQAVIQLDQNGSNTRKAYELFVGFAQRWIAAIRSEFAQDTARYKGWLPYARHYGNAAELAQLKDRYEAAFGNQAVETYLGLRSQFQQQLSQAEAFRALLLKQSESLESLDTRVGDLADQITGGPFSKRIPVADAEKISQLRERINLLRNTAAEDRGDVSEPIKSFGDELAALNSDIDAASTALKELNNQNEKLLALRSRLTEAINLVSKPPLEGLIELTMRDRLSKLSDQLNSELSVPVADRTSMNDEIGRIQSVLDESSGHIRTARSRLDELNRLDEKRRDLINEASAVINELSDTSLQSRLFENPLPQIEAERNRLSDLSSTPVWARPDYTSDLNQLQAKVGKARQSLEEKNKIDRLVQQMAEIKRQIDQRGIQYLDEPNSHALLRFLKAVAQFGQSQLPLGLTEKQLLASEEEELDAFQNALPAAMDKQERKLLIAEFPMQAAGWSFEFSVAKLTDAHSVVAKFSGAGDQATYTLEFYCKPGSSTLEIDAFDKGSSTPRPIFSEAPSKNIRLRTDDHALFSAVLKQAGYANRGVISGPSELDQNFEFLNSQRLVFGDIFANDEVEVKTKFPETFRRLCIMISARLGENLPIAASLSQAPKEETLKAPAPTPPLPGGNSIAVPLRQEGGTLLVPVTINGQLTLDFTVDSGASDVTIPADVVLTLVRSGTLTEADFLGTQTYRLADGSIIPSINFRIKFLKVGDRVLENVTGGVAPVQGSLLLGQSFLSRFKSWSIDNQRQVLVLEP